MRLIAYRIKKHARIEPARATRAWMDAWPKRHPYHCLPLTVVNSYGWQLLCPATFEAVWTGDQSTRSVVVTRIGATKGPVGYSHFGGGVLTFDPGCLLRTEAPTQLFVCGPLNEWKHGIAPLSAIVETSWLSFTFTMNWQFTAPDTTVRFEEGEPFCHFFPLIPDLIDEVEPEWRELAAEPEVFRQYHELCLSRDLTNGLFSVETQAESTKRRYEHHYHTGTSANGQKVAPRPCGHYTVRRFVETPTETLQASAVDDD